MAQKWENIQWAATFWVKMMPQIREQWSDCFMLIERLQLEQVHQNWTWEDWKKNFTWSDFCCNTGWSEFSIKNTKAWIQTALYQWLRFLMVHLFWHILGSFVPTEHIWNTADAWVLLVTITIPFWPSCDDCFERDKILHVSIGKITYYLKFLKVEKLLHFPRVYRIKEAYSLPWEG